MSAIVETKTINIKDLVIDEPRRSEDDLDPAKLLTDKDWVGIKDHFETLTGGDSDGDFVRGIDLAIFAKLSSPQRLSMFDKYKYLERIKRELKKYKEEDLYLGYLGLAASAKQLFSKEELNLETDEHFKKFVKDEQHRRGQFSSSSYFYRLVYPEVPLDSYTTEEYWQIIKKQVQDNKKRGDWWFVAYFSAITRLLFPDKFSEINLSNSDLQNIYQHLTFSKDTKSWYSFARVAWYLKILTADEVTVTDDGIQLIKHKTPFQENQQLPEVRRF